MCEAAFGTHTLTRAEKKQLYMYIYVEDVRTSVNVHVAQNKRGRGNDGEENGAHFPGSPAAVSNCEGGGEEGYKEG